MKYFYSILFLLFFANSAFCFNVKNFPSLAESKKNFPDAPAVIIKNKKKLTLNEDKTYTKEISLIKQVLTYKGKKDNSDIKIIYYPEYEKIKILEAYTITKDLKKIIIPGEAIHDIESELTVSSPDYINQHYKIINFPSIEPGSFIVLRYSISNTEKSEFSDIDYLKNNFPIMNKELEIIFSNKIKLYYDYKKDKKIVFTSKVDNNKTILSWTVKNIDNIKDEYNSPSYYLSGLPVIYSTENSWDNFSNRKFKNFLLTSTSNLNNQIKNLINEFKNIKDDYIKLNKIYNFISNNFIIKNSLIYKNSKSEMNINEIYSKKYGSIFEINYLYYNLAILSGVKECYPAIIIDNEIKYSDLKLLPIKYFMNNIALYWKGLLITPGKSTTPFAFAGVKSSPVIINKKNRKIKNYVFYNNFDIQKKIEISLLGEKNAFIYYLNSYYAEYEEYMRQTFQNISEAQRNLVFSQMAGNQSTFLISKPIFNNLKTPNLHLEVFYKTIVKNFYTNQNNFIYFTLPAIELPIKSGSRKRETPFYLDSSFKIKEEFVIKNIPDNYQLIKPIKNIILKENIDGFIFNYMLLLKKSDKNALIITRKIIIPECLINPQNYYKARQIINKFKNKKNCTIFLKKKL